MLNQVQHDVGGSARRNGRGFLDCAGASVEMTMRARLNRHSPDRPAILLPGGGMAQFLIARQFCCRAEVWRNSVARVPRWKERAHRICGDPGSGNRFAGPSGNRICGDWGSGNRFAGPSGNRICEDRVRQPICRTIGESDMRRRGSGNRFAGPSGNRICGDRESGNRFAGPSGNRICEDRVRQPICRPIGESDMRRPGPATDLLAHRGIRYAGTGSDNRFAGTSGVLQQPVNHRTPYKSPGARQKAVGVGVQDELPGARGDIRRHGFAELAEKVAAGGVGAEEHAFSAEP